MGYDLTIQQGSTFNQVFRWEDSSVSFCDITSISQTAPVQIVTAEPHGLTDGWRVAVVGAKGATFLNAQNAPPKAKDFFQVAVIDTTTIALPGVNGKNQPTYTTNSGVIQFAPSVDLTNYTARMQIRASVSDTGTPLAEFTTENGGITIDPVGQTVTITATAVATAAYTFTSAVYSLEMVDVTAATVTQLLTGNVAVLPEITK